MWTGSLDHFDFDSPATAYAVMLLLAGVIYWAFVKFGPGRAAFVIKLASGRATAVRGKVSGAFLDAVEDIASRAGVANGAITGVVVGRRIALRFTRDFQPDCRQRLRNLWATQGWAPNY